MGSPDSGTAHSGILNNIERDREAGDGMDSQVTTTSAP